MTPLPQRLLVRPRQAAVAEGRVLRRVGPPLARGVHHCDEPRRHAQLETPAPPMRLHERLLGPTATHLQLIGDALWSRSHWWPPGYHPRLCVRPSGTRDLLWSRSHWGAPGYHPRLRVQPPGVLMLPHVPFLSTKAPSRVAAQVPLQHRTHDCSLPLTFLEELRQSGGGIPLTVPTVPPRSRHQPPQPCQRHAVHRLFAHAALPELAPVLRPQPRT